MFYSIIHLAAGALIGVVLSFASSFLLSKQRINPSSSYNTFGRWTLRLARRLAFWLLTKAEPPNVDAAIKEGYAAAGVGLSFLDDSHDLMSTGKWHEVAYYAALRLGVPLRTTADLRAFLQKIAK